MNIDLKHFQKLSSPAQAAGAVDILVFKTNIRLKRDVRKIAILFDGHPLVKRWSVDITDIDKVIRIESINLLPGEVINALESQVIAVKNCLIKTGSPKKRGGVLSLLTFGLISQIIFNLTLPYMSTLSSPKEKIFTRYQVFMIAILAILQFTVILDFMVLSPLGALLLEKLHIATSQFGLVVSVYAFSAGASGLLTAGFADKFDRKKLLIFFYTGFIIGTLLCAIAPSYNLLLVGRIVTGLFGGVIGSVSFAIISDLFKLEVRGRVMGFVQMAFAASQVLGLPIGLVLANQFGWHSPFWMIAGFGVLVGVVIVVYMKPVTAHLLLQSDRSGFQHLAKTISESHYLRAFLATTLLSTGGFMLMPFGSAFGIHNIGLTMAQLPLLYGVTGIFSILFGPLIGKLSDKVGKYKIFVVGSIISMTMIAIYTNMGVTPLWLIIFINVCIFVGISSRMISASALMTAIPEPKDRGAFMSINASVQQISGGVASAVAGLIVVQTASGKLAHYNILGYVVICTMLVAVVMTYFLNAYVQKKQKRAKMEPVSEPILSETA